VGLCVENKVGASDASGALGHQGIRSSISDSDKLAGPATLPSVTDLPAAAPKPQSPPLRTSAASATAPIIPEADAIRFDAGVALPSTPPSASPSAHHSPHAASPPSHESPLNSVGKPANLQPVASSTSTPPLSHLPKTPSPLAVSGTESVFSEPSGAFPSAKDAPIPPSPSSVYRQAPQPSRDIAEVNDTGVMPRSPQPQQRVTSGLPSVPSPAGLQAGTNSNEPQASSSAPAGHELLLTALFGDDEGLSEPDGEKDADADDDILVEQSSPRHARAKRRRGASSSPQPPADTPRKRRRRGSFAVKEAAKPKPAGRSSRPAPSGSHSKPSKADVDMEMELDSGAGSEAEDEDMGGDEDAASEDPVGKGKGKGKAVEKASSSRHTSARRAPRAHKRGPQGGANYEGMLALEKDIPTTYRTLQNTLADDELMELHWFAPTHSGATRGKLPEKNPKVPVKGTPPPASQAPPTRCWHSFAAPTMTLDQDLDGVGEVWLLDGSFRFPFEAQVIECFSSLCMFLTFQIIGRARRELPSSRRATGKRFFVIATSISSYYCQMIAWAPFPSYRAAVG